ncbi:xylulokinase [Streptomyces sp. KR80]|uniref:xylulokinase n=1 Tax=Streptomyces sp. KR80 TaxID=3457426 RepID=UPI003FD1DC81
MSQRIVAGVDSSTQSTKVLVVDVDDGTVLASGLARHPVEGTDGARQTDPEAWWRALRDALAQTGFARQVAAIAVAGQQHGLVTLDRAGRPVRPALLWNDTRSAPEATLLIDALGGPAEWAACTGTVPVAAITATKWAWLRRAEPHHAAATSAVRLPHDFLTERLAGRAVTDRGDASGTGWYATSAGAYEPRVLDLPLLELDPALLPEVCPADQPVGTTRRPAANDLGLREACVVAAGTGDNMAAALGLGLTPGQPVLSLGTSGTAFAVSTRRPGDPTGVVAGFADATGRYLPLACTLNCTLAVDRVAALLGVSREDTEPGGNLVVLPFLDGERTPNLPRASGLLTGVRHDTTAGQILRAAYEGAVYALLDALERVSEVGSGVDPAAPLLLIGGGSRGAAWQDVVRRLSGRAALVPDQRELVALGAAAQAASCLTGEPATEIAQGWHTTRGAVHDPVARDDETLYRIAAVLDRSRPLLDA